ncbi:hypothetical protein B5M09_008458 [Aphanomyces astaci]|nr:hypothetical protein B5M09_008458 [Aphanomyces astaci]
MRADYAPTDRVVALRASKESEQALHEPLNPLNNRAGGNRHATLIDRSGPDRVAAPRASKESEQALREPLNPLSNRSGDHRHHVAPNELPASAPNPPSSRRSKKKQAMATAAPSTSTPAPPSTPSSPTKPAVKDAAVEDRAWRTEWYSSHPRSERSRPTEAEFAAAMAIFNDSDVDPASQRMAAMKGLPTPVQDEYPMLISCKSAAATFPLQIMLDCLAAGNQPSAWTDAKQYCRNFKRIKNVGIGFTCTDRDLVSRLGGLVLKICGRPFTVKKYSEYHHLYWVDVVLSDSTMPSDVWDYFMAHGDQPVLLQSSFSKNAIHSKHITVYFGNQRVPACLLLGADDPVREIMIKDQICIVTHKLSKFNLVTPPSIQQRSTKPSGRSTPKTKAMSRSEAPPANHTTADAAMVDPVDQDMDADDAALTKPSLPTTEHHTAFEDDGDDDSEYFPGSGDEDSDADDASGDDAMSTDADFMPSPRPPRPVVRPDFLHHEPAAAITPPLRNPPPSSQLWERASYSRRAVILNYPPPPTPTYAVEVAIDHTPGAVVHAFPEGYNRYSVLAYPSNEDNLAPLLDITVADTPGIYPAFPVKTYASTFDDLPTLNTTVESMSIAEVNAFISSFVAKYARCDDPTKSLTLIQGHPGFAAPLFDAKQPTNFEVITKKLPGHALQRLIQRELPHIDYATTIDQHFNSQVVPWWYFVFPSDDPAPTPLSALLRHVDTDALHLHSALALVCLFLQICQPELYFNTLKIHAVLSGLAPPPSVAVATLAALPHFLLTDAVLVSIAASPIGHMLMTSNIHPDVKAALSTLATLYPLPTHHVHGFRA